jgi:hypothetical protein
VELWFADSAALKAMSKSKAFDELCEDEHNFADRSRLAIVFTTERVVREGERAPSDLKRIVFFKREDGARPEDFQEQILAAANAPDAVPAAKRLVVSLPRLNGYAGGREPEWDGYEMSWFADLSEAQAAPVLNVGASASPALYCREFVVVQPY